MSTLDRLEAERFNVDLTKLRRTEAAYLGMEPLHAARRAAADREAEAAYRQQIAFIERAQQRNHKGIPTQGMPSLIGGGGA